MRPRLVEVRSEPAERVRGAATCRAVRPAALWRAWRALAVGTDGALGVVGVADRPRRLADFLSESGKVRIPASVSSQFRTKARHHARTGLWARNRSVGLEVWKTANRSCCWKPTKQPRPSGAPWTRSAVTAAPADSSRSRARGGQGCTPAIRFSRSTPRGRAACGSRSNGLMSFLGWGKEGNGAGLRATGLLPGSRLVSFRPFSLRIFASWPGPSHRVASITLVHPATFHPAAVGRPIEQAHHAVAQPAAVKAAFVHHVAVDRALGNVARRRRDCPRCSGFAVTSGRKSMRFVCKPCRNEIRTDRVIEVIRRRSGCAMRCSSCWSPITSTGQGRPRLECERCR